MVAVKEESDVVAGRATRGGELQPEDRNVIAGPKCAAEVFAQSTTTRALTLDPESGVTTWVGTYSMWIRSSRSMGLLTPSRVLN